MHFTLLNNFLGANIFSIFKDLVIDVQFTDILDILLVSFLIYIGLMLLKRTRSFFIFVGILIMSLLYLCARFFNLYLTSLLFQFFFTFSIVIFVIIFQKEFRNFFEMISMSVRRGFKGILGLSSIKTPESIATQLIKAVGYFAHNKIGALIVLRGKQSLSSVVDGGTELEGKVSVPLLFSIFDTSSPGHDGAIIIEGNMVKKFGVHLPLAERFMKFGDLGTRHRAGLGLAEQSDALVIIVSEERGTISLAYKGKLWVLSGIGELEDEIEKFVNENWSYGGGKKIWYGWFTKNLREKTISFVLASILWFLFVPKLGVITKSYDVPIEFRFLKNEFIIDQTEPNDIKVTLSGKTQEFQFLDPKYLNVVVNADTFEEGWRKIPIEEKNIGKPSFLSIINFSPHAINIHVSKVAEKQAAVEQTESQQ